MVSKGLMREDGAVNVDSGVQHTLFRLLKTTAES